MLRKIVAFELRYQLRSPLYFIGFALFFLLTFGATVNSNIHIGSLGNVNINSPFAILQTTGIMNVFGIFVLVAFIANTVIRDDDTGFAPIMRTTRISKFDYLVGRFVGAYLVALMVMVSVPLAIMVGSWMPWIDPDKLGPTVVTHYLYALFVYSAPTILTLGAAFFALATATRSMMWTYVGALALLVAFFVSQNFLSDPTHRTAASLGDPFALTAFEQATRYWTAADRNTLLPTLTGVLLYNRLIWIAAAVLFFVLAYFLFHFDVAGKRIKQTKPENNATRQQYSPQEADIHPLSPRQQPASWQQLWMVTRFDMSWIFKSPAFFVLVAIGILNVFGAMHGTVEFNNTQNFPVTRAMVDVLTGGFSVFPIIIGIFYSGELVWRDRERRMHEIVDATAAPDWTFMVPKVVAIILVLLVCFVAAVIASCIFQLYHGYAHLQLGAYLLWFVLPELISAVLIAILSIFVQTLVPHKAIGWAVMLLYIVAQVSLYSAGFEHNLYHYGGWPQVPLSDMNGMGRFWVGRAWFQVYWLAFGLLLLAAAQLLWRRGVDTSLLPRLRRMSKRFVGGTRWVTIAAGSVWLAAGGYIFYNTNILNEYSTEPQSDQRLADYEKALLPFEKLPQPTIVDVKLNVNIEPRQVRVTTAGQYVLENRTGAPLTEVHVRWMRPLKMQSLEIEGATLKKEYARFEYRIYKFATPMQPGEHRTLRFSSLYEQRGFANSNNLTRVVANGTFINNFEISPEIGMSRDALLRDRSKRRKYGLPADLRPAKLEDTAADAHNYLRHDSDWVTAQLTVTTDADQTPVAPGYTVSDTVTGNRRTLVTRTDAPIANFFSIQSARYAIKKDAWTGKNGQSVELAVYYYPQHAHNVQRMLNAMKTSLTLYSENFSPYQFHQLRIIEFPAYAQFAQSFANTIPYSEGIGFIQNFDDNKPDEHVDLVTYVTAHEVAHQWWAHQVIGADKQGMTMLSETFAQYSALLVMEKLYGKEQIRRFLKNELDTYLRSRGTEVVEELPLERVENQPYIHYNKGALAMYWLKEVVGEKVVKEALRDLLADYAFKAAPYPSSTDFLRHLRSLAGLQHQQLITDLFEKITLYDMKATEATAKKLPDGKYQVAFTVEGKKLYADGQGNETDVPLSEPFDIGVFTAEPGKSGYTRDSVIMLDRRVMTTGKQVIKLVVDREPKYVGVDPFNMRVDRNSDDNITPVTFTD